MLLPDTQTRSGVIRSTSNTKPKLEETVPPVESPNDAVPIPTERQQTGVIQTAANKSLNDMLAQAKAQAAAQAASAAEAKAAAEKAANEPPKLEDLDLGGLEGKGPVLRDVEKNELVQGQLETILSSDSPILQRARARAAELANERGLANSTFAAQAGESAVIDAAMPIATADASTYSRQGLVNQDVQNQMLAAERAGIIQGALNKQGFGGQWQLQRQAEKTQMEMQQRDLANRTELATIDAASRASVASMQASVAREEMRMRADLGRAELASRERISTMENDTRISIADKEVLSRQGMFNQQLQAQNTWNMQSLQANAMTSYTNQFSSIMSQPMDPADRERAVGNLNAVWSGSPYLSNIFNWNTAKPPAGAPPAG